MDRLLIALSVPTATRSLNVNIMYTETFSARIREKRLQARTREVEIGGEGDTTG